LASADWQQSMTSSRTRPNARYTYDQTTGTPGEEGPLCQPPVRQIELLNR
jgi:hypothetical protein